jgi:Cu/Ag efflux protein CusF
MKLRTLPLLVAALALALLSYAPARAEDSDNTHEGTVVKAGDGKLTMTDKDSKEHSHAITDEAKISCDGKKCKLEDLKEGTKVKVTTKKDGEKTVVTRIEGTAK